jgi:putative ABC transport system permease protein
MDTVLNDLRFALRSLVKGPGFTLIAVLTLALGIGANSAIFSLVNAVLLRPLSYPEPDRVLFLNESQPQLTTDSGFSYPDAEDLERQAHAFENLGWYFSTGSVFGHEGHAEQVRITFASHGVLRALRVSPILGGLPTTGDDVAGAGHTALLTYSFWQSHFAGDPKVVGRGITIDGKPFTVAGVLPETFWFQRSGAIWLPMGAWPYPRVRQDHWSMYVIARLKPGVTIPMARAELEAIASRLKQQYPATNALVTFRAVPLYDRVVGQVRTALVVLLSAVGFVLLIACVNVANLLLARATARQREMAIRQAMGASLARIVRQLLTESILLAIIGGAAGLLLARATFGMILRLGGDRLPRTGASIDSTVLWFTLAVSLLAGIVFGLLPALRSAQSAAASDLRDGGTYSSGRRHARLRVTLMFAEVALSVVLLVVAGLLIKSFSLLRGVDPGFNSHQLLLMGVSLPHGSYHSDIDKLIFSRRAIEQVAAIPGVQSVSVARSLPTEGDDWGTWFWAEGEPRPAEGHFPLVYMAWVSPAYFQTLEVPLLAGRNFTEADNQESEPVAIVNETFARHHWPHENPIGKHVYFPLGKPGARTVVGVVGSFKNDGLIVAPHDQLFIPYAQPTNAFGSPIIPFETLLVRTEVAPLSVAELVKHKLQGVDPAVAISSIQTMDDVLDDVVSDRRFSMLLLGLFSGLALLLAAVGIYGVISFSVSQRTHEIGIRMALGARTGLVQWMVVRTALETVVLAIAAGAAASLIVSRALSSLLFGVRSSDPEVFAVVTATLIAVGLLAAFIPARRAAKVDPMTALRRE